MKKKLIVALVMLTTSLCSCSNGKTKGIVDCYEIKVTNGVNAVFTGAYNKSYNGVFEYKSEDGNHIYADRNIIDNIYGGYCDILAYSNEYESYITYSYVGFIGFLTYEENYYLDLDNRIIDSETKWSKYTDNNLDDLVDEPVDNNKAYNYAKQNFYLLNGGILTDMNGKCCYSFQIDYSESSLERHAYTKLTDDCIISYRAKWF